MRKKRKWIAPLCFAAAVLLIVHFWSEKARMDKYSVRAPISQFTFIGDDLYYLERALSRIGMCWLYRYGGGEDDELLTGSPTDSMPYSEKQGLFYFVDGNTLQSYCPESGSINQVCAWEGDGQYIAETATDHYVLLTSLAEWRLVSLTDGSWRSVAADTLSRVFDVEGDRILLFSYGGEPVYTDDAFYLLDCEANRLEPLLEAPMGTSALAAACLWEGELWFTGPNGSLRCFALDSREELAAPDIKRVAALAAHGDFLVYATYGLGSRDDLTFCRLNRDGSIAELGVWEDAYYTGVGSCVLAVSDDRVVAASSSHGPMVFTCSTEGTP